MRNRLSSAITWLRAWVSSRSELARRHQQVLVKNREIKSDLRASREESEWRQDNIDARMLDIDGLRRELEEKSHAIDRLQAENEVLRQQIDGLSRAFELNDARMDRIIAQETALKIRATHSATQNMDVLDI
jgi:chromosome segregation ATPase